MVFDELTGLPRYPQLPQHEVRVGIFIDIDGFIWMNDSYGHQAGDLALLKIVATLEENAKRVSATVYRIGGDEFLLVLPIDAASNPAASCAQRCVETVSRLRIQRNPKRDIEARLLTISAVVCPINHRTAEQMRKVREWLGNELWRAKKERRDQTQIIVYQPERVPPWIAYGNHSLH